MLNFNSYRLPILMSLKMRGGTATPNEVAADVLENISHMLTYEDVTKITSGEVAWRNRLRWVKQHMSKENMIESGDTYGTWRITDLGRRNLKKWAGV